VTGPSGPRFISAVDIISDAMSFRLPVSVIFPLTVQLDPLTKLPVVIVNRNDKSYVATSINAIVDASGRTASATVTGTGTFAIPYTTDGNVVIQKLDPDRGPPGTAV